jgi:hypothetical protein
MPATPRVHFSAHAGVGTSGGLQAGRVGLGEFAACGLSTRVQTIARAYSSDLALAMAIMVALQVVAFFVMVQVITGLS